MSVRTISPWLLLAVATVCLSVGFVAGALAHRAYIYAMTHRTAPAETLERPVITGPKPAAQPDSIPANPDSETSQAPEAHQPAAVAVQALPLELAKRADGVLLWEAEWANRLTGSFACLASEDTGGGSALWAREGTGRNNDTRYHPPGKKFMDLGVADYWVQLPEAGRYRLYMRIWAMDKCGNSCWTQINGRGSQRYFPGGYSGAYGARNHVWPESMYQRWLWIEDEGIVYDLPAGSNRLHIEVREDGFAIDQIALVPVGGKAPSGILPPTCLPTVVEDEAGLPWSDSDMSTASLPVVTPFDAFLAMDHALLFPASAPGGSGWLTLRQNGNVPADLQVRLTSSLGTLSPYAEFTCQLTPEQPIARIPISLRLPPDAPRHTFTLRAEVRAPDTHPDLTVVRTVALTRPLEWWVLGPLNWTQDRQAGKALVKADELDVTRPLLDSAPKMHWVQAKAPDHYDAFGALDLNKVLGFQEHQVAYIATRVRVLKSGRYRIVAGGDDELRLRLDGKLVASDSDHAPLTDTLRAQAVSLEAGEHLLLGRVEQSRRWWQTFVQFRNEDGTPSSGVIGLPMQ